MKTLLLGGTGDAQHIAKALPEYGHQVLYSIAGLADKPTLPCQVRAGGFGGVAGLIDSLKANNINCLIDATHPYAGTISRHAVLAARALSIPLLRYTRAAWQAGERDHWETVDNNWPAIMAAITPYRRPLFTIGQQPLGHSQDILHHQDWLVRTLTSGSSQHARVHVLQGRGPFSYPSERALMLLNGIDVLVAKNSGGRAVAQKIIAARDLCIPVIMLRRPQLTPIDNEFCSIEALLVSLP